MRRSRLTLVAALAMTTTAAAVVVPSVAAAAPPAPPADVPVQLLAMNDFHGRISETSSRDAQLITDPGPDGVYGDPDPTDQVPADDIVSTVGGSAHVASTVTDARAAFVTGGGAEESSFFVGAGDLVSASTFESSVFKDEPTIEVLNAMGLDVSAVGNHEFDRGTEELRRISGATDGSYTDDVTACEGVTVGVDGCFGDAGHEFHGAEFPYLAANVRDADTGAPMLPPYQVFDVAGGQRIALIGVVTDTTPTIVAPAGITDVEFIDEAQAVNEFVPELRAQGIEAIGVLVHEGGTNTGTDSIDRNGCDRLSGPVVDINDGVDPAVDLIVSAHSHQAYNCMLTDRAGQPRLVTQAGYYGRLVTDIRLTLDGETGDVVRFCSDYRADNVPVLRDAPNAEVAAIVDYWNGRADEIGSQRVGEASAAIGSSASSSRAQETPLGNLIAQAQLEGAQADPGLGNPVVAFMNPGGLRADIAAGEITFAEAFAVQPFSNTVNAATLTGADIRAVLEQQFQLDQSRGSRLVLGTSDNLSYEYDESRAYGDRVDPASIMLDPDGTGPEPAAVLDPAAEYRVAANSFLIGGGDSFTAFARGTDPVTGPLDVDVLVDYLEANDPVDPPAADHSAQVPSDRPADPANVDSTPPVPVTTVDAYTGLNGPATPGPECDATAAISDDTPTRGQKVTVTGAGFAPRERVTVTLVGDNRTLGTARADSSGAVSLRVTVPPNLAAGEHEVVLTGTSGESASTTFTLESFQSDVRTIVRSVIQQLIDWLFRR